MVNTTTLAGVLAASRPPSQGMNIGNTLNTSFKAPMSLAQIAATGPNPTPKPAPVTGSKNIQAPAAPAATAAAAASGPLEWRDSSYNAQIAAIQRALQDFETGAQTRGERYGQDFTTGLQRLGYRPGEGFQAMPNILEALSARQMGADGTEGGVSLPAMGGSFDIEGQYDPYTAAAQGTRGLRDDFAGRGTLRSSDFARSFGEFQNRLNQQLEAMETGRTRFGQDLATDVSRERSATQDRLQAAQRDAMMRAAMGAAGMGGF
jgi:hypothetical protein